MNAIARPHNAEITLEKDSDADKEYFEALARMRKYKSNITAGTIKKIKAMDLPEISGNLSRKKFFFF